MFAGTKDLRPALAASLGTKQSAGQQVENPDMDLYPRGMPKTWSKLASRNRSIFSELCFPQPFLVASTSGRAFILYRQVEFQRVS